jgi:hypothetical protein
MFAPKTAVGTGGKSFSPIQPVTFSERGFAAVCRPPDMSGR